MYNVKEFRIELKKIRRKRPKMEYEEKNHRK
jgi:hypothetical protein